MLDDSTPSRDEPGAHGDRHPARPATLKEIGALAGVSIATVSKALNGRADVSRATRQRVQEAADRLKFTPNSLAQGLLAGRTGTVGLLTNDLEGRFSIPVLMGAEDAFGAGSVSVFLCDARGDAIREQHHIRALLSRRVDGLIVVGDTTNPRVPLAGSIPVPVVYAYAPSSDPRDMSVVNDNVSAGRMAAEHLVACGRTRIAYLSGDPAFTAAGERVAGAQAALREHGLDLVGGEALYGEWSEIWGRAGARSLLARHPEVDGIVCGSDQVARGVLDALRELGRHVPNDISVIGHDNWELLVTQSRPQLTTVDSNLQELGRTAARLLGEAIDGRTASGTHTVACRLVVRGSTLGAV
ncbi:LacI family DNA-binding transcriptional regulator [Leifsonia naganoensis]|uniref:LacI family transcriptional regulator n=1 Tax=Leifsonia naganoensis TaxID=150025 RepID=A0A853DSN6_9MICO|nr:LacI family DNA-binding transcriptional regulator [Leifsonia naganoensis]NYK10663.1 LacI family transcriptional regulator [Leifsonia naganoensis]